MALSVRHAKTVATPDSGDGKVSSNAWNDGHVLTGTANMLVGFDGLGNGTEIDPTTIATSGISPVASRAALAAITVYTLPFYLTESGREGTFVWSSANNSANVTADTAQGVYVAPASDTSGASGAWVRHPGVDGSVNVKWFGAVADNATDDSAAFLAALAFRKALSTSGFGDSRGGGDLFISKGTYYLGTTTLDIYSAINLRGESAGSNGGPATVLRWADGTTGIRVHNGVTFGASGTRTADGFSGDGTILEKLFLQGGFTTTESESHGIHARGKITVRDCYINLFSGDGIYCNATAGSGGATEGNTNNSYVERVTVQGNRNGIFWQGADSSAGLFICVNALYNRRWGIWDNSFLSNGHFGHHASTNGLVNVGGSVPYVLVSYSGNLYSLVQGGNHANAPSGTTADTADWYYARSGGVGSYSPAWTNVVSVRDGGPYFSSTSAFRSCYSEGDQGVSQCVVAGLMDGYSHLAGVKGNGIYERSVAGIAGGAVAFKNLNCGLRVTGVNPNYSGPAGVEFLFSGGSAYIQTIDRDAGNVFQPLIINSSGQTVQVSGTVIATFASTGFNLASGKVLQSNGTTIINGSGVLQAAGFPTLTGDVTNSGLATTIAAGAVSLAKMANVATGTVFYRKTAGTGAPEVNTLATLKTDLGLAGTNSGDQTITLTGDVTGTGTGSFATAIGANKVTRAMMANTAAATVLGSTSAGAVAELTAAQTKTFLAIAESDVASLTTDLAAKAPVANPQHTGVAYYQQSAPVARNSTTTLTIADLLTLIVTATSSTAVSLTLPTGTLTDAGILGGALAVDEAFEWYVINLGSSSGAVTLVAGTAHTIVGSAVVAIGTSARFLTRKTATNTFVTYRIA